MRKFVAADGERFAMLVDGAGMPLYYPNLFATWELRGRSLAANSIVNALSAVKALYAWQARYGIDLESMFSRGELLNEEQIRDLIDFLQLARPSANEVGKVVRIRSRARTVSTSIHYFRVSQAASYLQFLANRLCPKEGGAAAKVMISRIKAHRPRKRSRSSSDRDDQYLEETVVAFIAEALKPNSNLNPARAYALQLRNMLMFMLLRYTGMRRGELLNLRVDDFDFRKETLTVVRRPDSRGDVRVHQPTAKTLQRTIPIASELIDKIHGYVLKHRNKLSVAKTHGYLFVIHKEGPTLGRPVSISTFQKWMKKIAGLVDDSGLHAHALRHHWNYNFSMAMDEKEMSPEKVAKIRSYLMGWDQTSDTASTYDKRHVKQKASEAVLELQNKHLKKSEKEVAGE